MCGPDWDPGTTKQKGHMGKSKEIWKSIDSLVVWMVKKLPAIQETQVWSLGWDDTLEESMATHSSILAWRILGTEESGGLQPMGSPKFGHDWATKFLFVGRNVLTKVKEEWKSWLKAQHSEN